ncbi:sugar ABC transporter permease [Paenibacillus albiflavus]|uniref:Sugar ABC transporter permease n=1 Tax=Paenibacillus albiflavus TaxID=2545760 RepID=A0A4R4E9D2_9BACL|nr:sugar ABC transporter permease [Paenibacillus albiflavus]TCZ74701.1 sugar ABC transporter permease [Paenibacillus albiflavus]
MGHKRVKAAVLSLVVLGLGQIFNRQYVKGIILLLIDILGITFFSNTLAHAIWGIYTLGEAPSQMVLVDGITKNVPGDHSIFLLIEGIIVLILFLIFVSIYIYGVRDAYQVGKACDQGELTPGVKLFKYKTDKFPYVLLILPAIGVLFITVMPVIFMILVSFTNYFAPEHIPPANLVSWTGFQTYIDLVQLKMWSSTFFGVLSWTVIWAIIATTTCYFGGLLVALLIQQKGIRFKSAWRTIFILPYAIPQIISLLVMRNLFNGQFGPINQYLAFFGLDKIPWLTDPLWAKVTVIVVNMWVGIPVSLILILGILTSIHRDLYEAAEVDGASAYQKFRVITLPMVMFATAPVLIMQFAGNINNFNVIYLMTNGDPKVGDYRFAGATDLLVTWLYKLTLDNSQFNIASAVGIVIFIMVASLSIWSFRKTASFREEDIIQ